MTLLYDSFLAASDFTIARYEKLLELAAARYKFVRYCDIAPGWTGLLWRHDCDVSLNRALRLAQLEAARSVRSTFFVNPHCEFYSFLERSQTLILREIVALGHDIGLHFDAEYYDVTSEAVLAGLVTKEVAWLADVSGSEPTVFSFHNPTPFLLTCEAEQYGGALNCYSKSFKSDVDYCSDSNGYWRFQPLCEVLDRARSPRLQVLTHAEWWQERTMSPRERISRSIRGRADAALTLYDRVLEMHGRTNDAGPAQKLSFLKNADRERYRLCDTLWNSGEFATLFLELHRMRERLKRRAQEAQVHADARLVAEWSDLRERISDGDEPPPDVLERACTGLCETIKRIVERADGSPAIAAQGDDGRGQ